MILSLIIIVFLLAILNKMELISLPEKLTFLQAIGIILILFIIVLIDHAYYEPDYDKIREIIREELEKKKKIDEYEGWGAGGDD